MSEDTKFSPSSFMKARRPELFSDALEAIQIPPLDKSVFEYHLDTLTSRKEEIRFEHFCRKLAEKEIAPNLLPQTGPTGGGDSKVDSETYPVDASISMRWYQGQQQAASDRWAFAFSAKRDWVPKVRSDVEKLVDAGRGYTKVFFITNQFVPDRKRAAVEDELTKQFALDVRILDRTWIIEKIFDNRRWELVYQTLDIQRPASKPKSMPGPLDEQRRLALSELDAQIAEADRYLGSDYQLVEDCLQSALLARNIGATRAELEGRFERAARLAHQRQDSAQFFRVQYNRMWTDFWWWDDVAAVDRGYDAAEALVIAQESVWSLEKLVNLWHLGVSQVADTRGEEKTARWDARTGRLLSALAVKAADTDRPTSALWAETQICLMQLTLSLRDGGDAGPILQSLRAIVQRAQGSLEYPFDAVSQVVQEIGAFLGSHSEYEEVFETVMALHAARSGKGEEGRFRIERGRQKLRVGDYYGALIQFARAQHLLAHEEHREDFMLCLAGTALAYDALGLSWAARASLIFGLSLTLSEFDKSGEVPPRAVSLVRKLVWLELRLGRMAAVMLWIDMLNTLTKIKPGGEDDLRQIREERMLAEGVMCILLLRTRPEDWMSLGGMLAYLDHLELPMARGAVLFALGHEEQLRSEFDLPEGEDIHGFMGRLMRQPAADDVPPVADWHVGTRVVMGTSILGCQVALEATNTSETIAWGETILAALEAFFSTLLAQKGVVAMRPQLCIRVEPSDQELSPPLLSEVRTDENGETSLHVLHSGSRLVPSAQDDRFGEGVVGLVARTAGLIQVPLSKDVLENHFSEERAQDRAVLAAQSIASVAGLLGDPPKYHIALQMGEILREPLDFVRDVQWSAPEAEKQASVTNQIAHSSTRLSAGPQTHKTIQTLSVINMPLWDDAQWRGAVFLTAEGAAPILALYFEDEDAAAKIMRGWAKEFGEADEAERIRVSIITGVDAAHPSHYRIAITSRLPDALSAVRQYVITTRSQEMTPSDSANLDRFLAAYESAGAYFLGAASGGPPQVLEPIISKRDLEVLPAWTIGPDSALISALRADDNPLVPDERPEAPIWAALNQIRDLRG